jgi:Icc-related predicted phosphoesterase
MVLRFLCLSDTHGHPLPRFSEHEVGAWLHAGDFCDMGAQLMGATARRMIEQWAVERRVPAIAVRGNHDCGNGAYFLASCMWDITEKVLRFAPHLLIAVIGWSGIDFRDIPIETALGEVCQKVIASARVQMAAEDQLVLLTHYPARLPEVFPPGRKTGIAYDCVRAVIDLLHPMAVVQGHQHALFQSQGVYEKDGRRSLIANPGPLGGVLKIDIEQQSADFDFIDSTAP